MHAPELDSRPGWLNTDRPLRLDGELAGRIVVLDFWTYCCINCIHILPDLAFLEDKYADQPVVFIGVHSAKFTNEADRETIRAAILRYQIRHPVVIDEDMRLWRAYGVRSWPTQVVIDAAGRIVGAVAGENQRDAVDRMIAEALARGQAEGVLASGPLSFRREQTPPADSGLSFPGKVFADPELKLIFVADSNHNRILVASWPDAAGNSRVVCIVGSGPPGADDGAADAATFRNPQGMVTGQGRLYVADTDNHLIRAIDLTDYSVRTLVGIGRMTYDFSGGAMGTQQGINSPWDLTREGSTLYVAMAGQHQIWRIDLPVGFARALAGTGRENLADGPTERAAFAQPSGICWHHGSLIVADSEVSAIRRIDMATERVSTVLGEGLFTFGDVDGRHPKARLQHPLGVTSWGSVVLVADTYNHKIKAVDPMARSARTLFGTGRPGRRTGDGELMLFEPGGLCCVGDDLFIADTNNHRIVHVNLITRAWREVRLQGLLAPDAAEADSAAARVVHQTDKSAGNRTSYVVSPPARASRSATVCVSIDLPCDVHLNAEATWRLRVEANGMLLAERRERSSGFPLCVDVPDDAVRDATRWQVTAEFICCTDGAGGACVPIERTWTVDIPPGTNHPPLIRLIGELSPAELGMTDAE